MIDLSNNNGTNHNFKTAFVKSGERRLYLKEVEGMAFVDNTYLIMKKAAEKVGFKVGPYDFLHPLDATPKEVLDYFLNHAYSISHEHSLRPCFDCEYGSPSVKVGQWVTEIATLYTRTLGYKPVIYGNGYFLEACKFAVAPGPLWLAAYGRDDGREYPVGRLPRPWKVLTAHQYSQHGRVVGINGQCDISHVFKAAQIDVPATRKS